MKLLNRKDKTELIATHEMVGSPEYLLIMRLEELFQEFAPMNYLFAFDLAGTSVVAGQGKGISQLLKAIGEHTQQEAEQELIIGTEEAQEE